MALLIDLVGSLVPIDAVHLHFMGCVRTELSACALLHILHALLSGRRKSLQELGLHIGQNVMRPQTLAQIFHMVLSHAIRR